jgi:large subunit ribosomal protein L23
VNKNIIRRVLTTEKTTRLTETGNQYAFDVARDANKLEIRSAVEAQFNVKVKDVNTMNRRGKSKRLRTQKYGRTSDWKRAVVTLEAGQKIELA